MSDEERDLVILQLSQSVKQLGEAVALGGQAHLCSAHHSRAQHILLQTLLWLVAERPDLHTRFKQVLGNVREASTAISLGTDTPDESFDEIDSLLEVFLPPALRSAA